MTEPLRIGEYSSLGMAPYFYSLRNLFPDPGRFFYQGTSAVLDQALERGELDVAVASPLLAAASPLDYYVIPDLGYASRRHVKDLLLFSDMLLDDMDEMALSCPEGEVMANALIRLVLGRYLQYQVQFILGWGNAEAYLLAGDAALRERILARYSYVYDLGDLWKHYTQQPLIYYLWVVRKEALRKKRGQIILLHRLLKKAVEVASADWDRFSILVPGYEWMKRSAVTALWDQIDYRLSSAHFDGLERFYEDCADFGIIDEVPELQFLEED